MLKIVNGNIFDSDANIICHQVNTFGIMGGGIALQVKNRFPIVYQEYKDLCDENKNNNLLGNVLFSYYDENKMIANCFSQDGWETDYNALRDCLIKVRSNCQQSIRSVALPYNYGCGIAKGDWNIVYNIIQEIFENTLIDCVIYKLEQ